MSLRRAATSVITLVIACGCALSVPFSQLRTYAAVTTCCCPDPAHCHCPDHTGHQSKDAQLRACHRSTDFSSAPEAPELVPPPVIALAPVIRHVTFDQVSHAPPHDAPSPARPAAPS